ncbi:MAG: ABC transporter permease, partial [Caldilineaceae bacterium]|nr:ABC transporter permease [Caldilineaceae bacterium]
MTLLHPTFIRRQLATTRSQSLIFVLCVALSMVTLVALRGFGDSVDRALTRDARALIGADVVVQSNFAFDPAVDSAVEAIAARGAAETARTWEFYSVVRRPGEDGSLLSNLKVVDAGWPFYGTVELASGAALRDVLAPGRVIVEQALLDRLGVQVGDALRIGDATLTIADVITFEPDRPTTFFSLGPRVLVDGGDLAALNLVNPGSRVTYRWLLKAADPAAVDDLAGEVRAVADRDFVRIDTFRTARTGVERFFTNFLFFLSLVGIFTLMLAGIGIQSSLTAFLRERHSTIAVAKTLGASSRFVTVNFYIVVLLLGAIGALLGILLGFVLQWTLPALLSGFLPPDIELTISTRAVVESALLGLVVVLLFTFLPLYRLEGLRPSFIFRKEEPPIVNRLPFALTLLLILCLFTGLVIWQLGDVRTALWFAGGALVLLLIAALLTEAALQLLKR